MGLFDGGAYLLLLAPEHETERISGLQISHRVPIFLHPLGHVGVTVPP